MTHPLKVARDLVYSPGKRIMMVRIVMLLMERRQLLARLEAIDAEINSRLPDCRVTIKG